MFTLIFLFCFCGFFMIYNTSKRARLSTSGAFEVWLQKHAPQAKWMGAVLLLLSMILFVKMTGWGTGLFAGVLLLMTAASLVVVIAPFQYLNIRYLVMIVTIAMVLELIFSDNNACK